MVESPIFLILVIVVVFMLVVLFWPGRRKIATDSRMCQACGAGNPPVAEYCRRCGKKF